MNPESLTGVIPPSLLFLLTAAIVGAMPSAQTHLRPAQRDWRRGASDDDVSNDQPRSIAGTSAVHIWTFQRSPPTYFTLLFQQLSASKSEEFVGGQGSEGPATLLRTLLPFQLSYGGGQDLMASFNLSSLEGGFPSAEIIFTLLRKERRGRSRFHDFKTRNDDTEGGITLSIQAHASQGMGMKDELELVGRNFYRIDVTDFLEEIRKKEPGIVQLEMTLSRTDPEGDEIFIPMEHLFQTDSYNAPFVLFHQAQFDPLPGDEGGLRGKRSVVPAPPATSKPTPFPLRPPLEAHTESRSNCHKEEWLVRPSDIGLDDILAPEYLDLGYCAGECPFPLLNDVYNFSLHSYFIDRHRILRGLEHTPGKLPHSSCVAVSYKPLMIMEEGASGQMVSIHKNALVQACGCRY